MKWRVTIRKVPSLMRKGELVPVRAHGAAWVDWINHGFDVKPLPKSQGGFLVSHCSRHALTLLRLRDPEFLVYYIVEEL